MKTRKPLKKITIVGEEYSVETFIVGRASVAFQSLVDYWEDLTWIRDDKIISFESVKYSIKGTVEVLDIKELPYRSVFSLASLIGFPRSEHSKPRPPRKFYDIKKGR